MTMATVVVALLAVSQYPLYKQCDARWAKDTMGVKGPGKRRDICAEGCAMSCVAMMLDGSDFLIPGTTNYMFHTWVRDIAKYSGQVVSLAEIFILVP